MTPEEFAARLEKAATRLPVVNYANLQHEGTLLRALIQAHASGRPGPNVITGAYLASWQVAATMLGRGAQVTVGTMAPQAARLEFGFTGTDSLGRTFAQPPFPHVGPAVDTFGDGFNERTLRAVKAVFD